MKIIISADAKHKDTKEPRQAVEVVFEELGSEAYVRMTIQGVEYDFGYADFLDAANAVCIHSR